jgi:hypothetical protein
MTTNIDIKLDFKGLEKIEKAIRGNFQVRVGILGGSAQRQDEEGEEDDSINNAELGIIQEFGSISKGIPPRSFLRMPLEEKKTELVKWLQKQDLEKMLQSKDFLKDTLARWGVKAEEIVDSAFSTSGFGKWLANSPATTEKKKSSKPLINTQQLRRSITSEVVSKNG